MYDVDGNAAWKGVMLWPLVNVLFEPDSTSEARRQEQIRMISLLRWSCWFTKKKLCEQRLKLKRIRHNDQGTKNIEKTSKECSRSTYLRAGLAHRRSGESGKWRLGRNETMCGLCIQIGTRLCTRHCTKMQKRYNKRIKINSKLKTTDNLIIRFWLTVLIANYLYIRCWEEKRWIRGKWSTSMAYKGIIYRFTQDQWISCTTG